MLPYKICKAASPFGCQLDWRKLHNSGKTNVGRIEMDQKPSAANDLLFEVKNGILPIMPTVVSQKLSRTALMFVKDNFLFLGGIEWLRWV
jgi:hypothetical protein